MPSPLSSSQLRASLSALALAFFVVGCGGALPELHPTHAMHPGKQEVTAGMATEVAIGLPYSYTEATQDPTDPNYPSAQMTQLLVAPTVSPWFSGRFGITKEVELGLAYSGRALRGDGRYVVDLGDFAFSAGLGLSLIPQQFASSGEGQFQVIGNGVGTDLPVLFGWRSSAELVQLWTGLKFRYEYLAGNLPYRDDLIDSGAAPERTTSDLSGNRLSLGALAGIAFLVRPVSIRFEVMMSKHWGFGEYLGSPLDIELWSFSPAGAIAYQF